MLSPTQLLEVVREEMSRWPLYDSKHIVRVHPMGDRFSIVYRPNMTAEHGFETGWSANIIGDVFYLLSIRIPPEFRGKGLGQAMYGICESIAIRAGCKEIRQTPSGKTITGETRREYLVRHGWSEATEEVFKRFDEGLDDVPTAGV